MECNRTDDLFFDLHLFERVSFPRLFFFFEPFPLYLQQRVMTVICETSPPIFSVSPNLVTGDMLLLICSHEYSKWKR